MRTVILFFLPLLAWADSAEIRLQAQFWSKKDETFLLIGQKQPIVLNLRASAGAFDLRKQKVVSEEVSVEIVGILSLKSEPGHLVFQTHLKNSSGDSIAECSSIQTVLKGAVYGVGACTGFTQGTQYGITLYKD